MKKKLIVMYLVSAISGLLANVFFWTAMIMYGVVAPTWVFVTEWIVMPMALVCALWSIYNLIKLIRDNEQP